MLNIVPEVNEFGKFNEIVIQIFWGLFEESENCFFPCGERKRAMKTELLSTSY